MTALIKQPAENLLYDLPMGNIGAGAITAVTALTATAKGLVPPVTALSVDNPTFAGDRVQFRATGGTDGELYLITVRATLSTGDTVEAEGELRVLDLGWTLPAAPGATYIEPQAYVDRFGLAELVRLTDADGVGRIDKGAFFAALADATAEVDAYLGKRYMTPLSPVPALIIQVTADLARYKLHADNAPDSVLARYRDGIRTLDRLAQGLAVLPGVAVPTGGGSGMPAYTAPQGVFTRDTLEGF